MMPRAAMVTNQMHMIGPNAFPITPLPRLWIANSPIKMTTAICVVYTHRGVDIDGSSWPTTRFIETDIHVKEGLAQYYTEQVMRALGTRLPDGLETFLTKTSKQSPPYTDYQNWLGEKTQPSPEAVRLTMLGFRNLKTPTFTNEAFLEMLRLSQMQMRGGN
jgi:hypothetical protein